MVRVVGVRFKKAGKIYYFDPAELPVVGGSKVIVETARGIEYGDVAVGPRDVDDAEVVQPLKKVIRIGSEKDATQVAENKRKEKEAFAIAVRKIAAHGLDMNLVDVEYTFDGSKIIFYFTAEGRVDFRELVKDLAGVFRTRIEMRQIGVRDEAKLLGGIGPCGRILCCTSFLGEFAPVSIRMAKDQNLSLNPTKISGICGRLMCCLRYEQDTYEAAKRDPTLAPGYVPPALLEADSPVAAPPEDEPDGRSWKSGPLRLDSGEGELGGRVSRATALKHAAARDADIAMPIRVTGAAEAARGIRPAERLARGEQPPGPAAGGRGAGLRPPQPGRPQPGKPPLAGKPQQQGKPPQPGNQQPQAGRMAQAGKPGSVPRPPQPGKAEKQGQGARPRPSQPARPAPAAPEGKGKPPAPPPGQNRPRGERSQQSVPAQQRPEQGQGRPRNRDGRGPRPENAES